ncbi:MAG: exo-alpha-sialidase [Bacteroidales bacterium]|nr:exo-alpha-sialidase [Bacteroidales bacterium]
MQKKLPQTNKHFHDNHFPYFLLIALFLFLFQEQAFARKKISEKTKTAETIYPKDLFNNLTYRNIGPFRGGRSVAVAGSAEQPQTFYFGGAAGGVWKTVDGGITWKNVSDKFFKSSAVGALAVAPSNPNIIYAGMGESFIRGNMATGDGIYKSDDAGKTWQHMGLTETHVISNIVVNPHNPNIVYVAAMGHVFADNPERGIYRSEDGGKTWKKILYVDDKTGSSFIAMDPNNSQILFAGMWQAYRKPWIFSSGGAGSGLYKSTDGGNTWKNISHNLGLPAGILGKICVNVAPSNSDRVYAIIENKNGGVFRSDDGGKTWKRLYHGSNLTQRAWYFSRIYIDPKNDNLVYAPQVSGILKSVDGGMSFSPMGTPHGDNHVMWIDPKNPNIMINGNDGGASVSYNGGKSWSSQDNQPTAQFYHVAVDNDFPYHIYGAQQDNSTVKILSRTSGYAITDKDWWPIGGGESGYVAPDPTNSNITYGGEYDGVIVKYNQKTGQSQNVDVWPDNPMGYGAKDLRDRFQWTFPIVFSPDNPKILYTASQYVYRSDDAGMSWTRISPDLTRHDTTKEIASGGPITKDNTAVEYYNTVFAFAESPVKAGVLWAGSDDGLVHVSTDNGKTWTNVTPKDMPEWTTISIIEPSHFDAGTAFIAARRYRQDDFAPYIYKTTDYGKHWEKIIKGLPKDGSSFVVRQDTKDPNLLYAGNLTGVYVSFNGGEQWQSLQLNLPPVPVRDMVIQNRDNDLVLATHGRAFWILDNIEVLRQINEKEEHSDAFLFKPEKTYLTRGYGFHIPAGMPYGENPPNGLVVYYYLKNAPKVNQTVKLEFLTEDGKQIITFSNNETVTGKPMHVTKDFYADTTKTQRGFLPAQTGLNQFVWNLRYPDAKAVPGAVIWDGDMEGPRVVPGTYQMKLIVGKDTLMRNFEVVIDPRYSVTQSDLQAQFDLLTKIHAKLNQTNESILKIRKVKDEIDGYLSRLSGYPQKDSLEKIAKPLVTNLNKIEDALIQVKSHASEDPLNYPVRLNNKLAALAASVGDSYNRPTKQDYEVFEELSKQVDVQLDTLKPLLDQQVKSFNGLVDALHIPAVYLPQKK